MLLTALTGAVVGGFTGTFTRAATLQIGLDQGHTSFATVFFVCISLSLVSAQLFLINKAIQFYDQVEVMPIYNTFLIFMNMFCGAVILDEYKMYSVGEMLYLFLCLCTSVGGIFLLVKKPDLTSCFKTTARKTVGSTMVENNSIMNLTIEGVKAHDSYE